MISHTKKRHISRDVRFSEDTPYYPATGQEEDDFNLFPLPSSSYYDQNVCSLPQLVPEVPDIRVQPVVDQSPSTTAV